MKEKNPKSFEEALSELELITERLEQGQLTLEESILAYERGVELKEFCESKLKEAEGRIEMLTDPSLGPVSKTTIQKKQLSE